MLQVEAKVSVIIPFKSVKGDNNFCQNTIQTLALCQNITLVIANNYVEFHEIILNRIIVVWPWFKSCIRQQWPGCR